MFLGTANALANGGPIGLLLGYTIVGTICYSVMVRFRPSIHPPLTITESYLQISLGEMVAYLPIPGGHIKLAERFVDPALSFTMGWNYWYNWAIILPGELSAAAILINFWNQVSWHFPFTHRFSIHNSPSLLNPPASAIVRVLLSFLSDTHSTFLEREQFGLDIYMPRRVCDYQSFWSG